MTKPRQPEHKIKLELASASQREETSADIDVEKLRLTPLGAALRKAIDSAIADKTEDVIVLDEIAAFLKNPTIFISTEDRLCSNELATFFSNRLHGVLSEQGIDSLVFVDNNDYPSRQILPVNHE